MRWLTEALPLLVVLAVVGEIGILGAVLYVRREVMRAIRELEGRIDVLIKPRIEP